MFCLATEPEFHEEIASYGLGGYISSGALLFYQCLYTTQNLTISVSEYREAMQRSPLSYEDADDLYLAFNPRRSPITDMFRSFLGDLPLVRTIEHLLINHIIELPISSDIFRPAYGRRS